MQLTKTQKTNVTLLNIFLPFLLGTCIDLYVPSLPAITQHYHVSNHLVQLTISLYLLGYAGGQIFLGVLSDSFGRKKVLLVSILCFTIVSFMTPFSPNIYVLNFYRLLQGLSAAGFGALSRAIAVDCFSGISLNKAMTYISTSWALGPILGPFLGGYLQHYFNWQADFYFFGIYGLFLFAYTVLAIPETNQHLRPLRPQKTLKAIRTIVTHPYFLLTTAVLSLFYASLVLFNILGPFLIQVTLKFSALDYGHIALLLGVGNFSGNLTNRVIIHYFNPMKITLCAILGALSMSLLMLILGLLYKLNLYIILIPVFILFYCAGFTFPNLMGRAIGLFPKMAGSASALFGSLATSGVFLMTLFATQLKTNTQMPLAITYCTLIFIATILFFVSKRFDEAR